MSQESAQKISETDLDLIQSLDQQIRNYVHEHGTDEEQQLLNLAIEDIRKYHENQMRKSGQPFIIHPLRVANSICQVGLDASTVIASLLHDIIEDTPITYEDISERYGVWYADIVKGLTKIIQTEKSGKSVADLDATYQRMLKAMTHDVRALFIKLFDRLDNMRDMEAMPRIKQRRISQETLNVYVPMAGKLGLSHICLEHTELCFKILYPQRYRKTLQDIGDLKKARMPAIQAIKKRLESAFKENKLNYKKIEPIFLHPAACVHPKGPMDRVLERFRVVVDNKLSCFQALGVLHTTLTVIPLKIRDYISNPLWSGYEGIQTELNVEGEQTIIEIVSKEMLEKNEFGIMAHWQGSPTELTDYYNAYLKQLEQLAGEEDVRMLDILNYVQADQIQVYSPKGDMSVLPKGATVLDFAYTIHSEIGDHCIGGFINPSTRKTKTTNKRVPRERQLFDGDKLEIITDPGVQPNPDWLSAVKTSKSKYHINRSVTQQNATGVRNKGKASLKKLLLSLGDKREVDAWFESANVLKALKSEELTEDRFLMEIGLQKRSSRQFIKKYKLIETDAANRFKDMMRSGLWQNLFYEKEQFLIDDPSDAFIRLANCCVPIPGDKIVGFANDDTEVEIHRANCTEYSNRESQPKSEPIKVAWNVPKNIENIHTLYMNVKDGKGILYKLTRIIKDAGVAILDSQSASKKNKEAEIRIKLEPITWSVYHKIVEGIRPLKFVNKVWGKYTP